MLRVPALGRVREGRVGLLEATSICTSVLRSLALRRRCLKACGLDSSLRRLGILQVLLYDFSERGRSGFADDYISPQLAAGAGCLRLSAPGKVGSAGCVRHGRRVLVAKPTQSAQDSQQEFRLRLPSRKLR